MKNVYKIYHCYSTKEDALYIETDMSAEEVANILVGLQFYTEDFTEHGEHTCVTEAQASYFLCNCLDCTEYAVSELPKLEFYDVDEEDLHMIDWIDMYSEREHRCGTDYKKYIELIKPYLETEYLVKLRAFFNDNSVFDMAPYKMLSPQEIMEKY